jgi:hypothetical protein
MIRIILATVAGLVLAVPAAAQPADEPSTPERLEIRPILETRARFEHVEGALEGDALTLRLRAGAEASLGSIALIAEAEATLAPVDRYSAFPFALPGENQWRPAYAVVADPQNAELNRLQLQYRFDEGTLTAGRQRINLDDQRWVGSVGWRQNEQTFDALRAEARLGPVGVDLIYSISQRTIFGSDAGPRTAFDGDFAFVGLSVRQGAVQGKLFAYLLDYEEPFLLANSSQTYGGFLAAALPLAEDTRLNLRASYARQFDHARNPFDYGADYWSLEVGTTLAGFNLAAGWEQLGSDSGRAVQTPMATLHKFNGWADLFLTTPPGGLQDTYVSVSRSFEDVRQLPGLNFVLALHRFDSAVGDIDYGFELDASVGFRIAPFGVLFKYARYEADGFGADTTKFWVQLEWSL